MTPPTMTLGEKLEIVISNLRTQMGGVPRLSLEVYPHRGGDGFAEGERCYELSFADHCVVHAYGKSLDEAADRAVAMTAQIIRDRQAWAQEQCARVAADIEFYERTLRELEERMEGKP